MSCIHLCITYGVIFVCPPSFVLFLDKGKQKCFPMSDLKLAAASVLSDFVTQFSLARPGIHHEMMCAQESTEKVVPHGSVLHYFMAKKLPSLFKIASYKPSFVHNDNETHSLWYWPLFNKFHFQTCIEQTNWTIHLSTACSYNQKQFSNIFSVSHICSLATYFVCIPLLIHKAVPLLYASPHA